MEREDKNTKYIRRGIIDTLVNFIMWHLKVRIYCFKTHHA